MTESVVFYVLKRNGDTQGPQKYSKMMFHPSLEVAEGLYMLCETGTKSNKYFFLCIHHGFSF